MDNGVNLQDISGSWWHVLLTLFEQVAEGPLWDVYDWHLAFESNSYSDRDASGNTGISAKAMPF